MCLIACLSVHIVNEQFNEVEEVVYEFKMFNVCDGVVAAPNCSVELRQTETVHAF